jgi:hypothetical protein
MARHANHLEVPRQPGRPPDTLPWSRSDYFDEASAEALDQLTTGNTSMV